MLLDEIHAGDEIGITMYLQEIADGESTARKSTVELAIKKLQELEIAPKKVSIMVEVGKEAMDCAFLYCLFFPLKKVRFLT